MADISARKGDTIPIEVRMTRSVPGIDPFDEPLTYPVDLSGSVKIWFTAKRAHTDPDASAVIRLGTTNTGLSGVNVENPPNEGRARVTIPPASTTGLEAGTVFLIYDVQLLELDGTVTTVSNGRLALLDHITIAAA
jgi:hypothetical protein